MNKNREIEIKMKNKLFLIVSTVILTACGGADHSNDSSVVQNTNNNFYSFQQGGMGYNLDPVNYSIDKNKNLIVKPFVSEASKLYATVDGYSTTQAPQIDKESYLIGEQASFDGEKLEYSVSNFSQEKPLIFTYHLKKVDVSNVFIGDDVNNPIRQLYSSVTGQILASILGMPSLSELGLFPKGSICWQNLSKTSNHDYIDFDTTSDYSQFFVDANVDATGTWGNVTWVRFKDKNYPNTKLTIEGKEYWGQYHFQNESFEHAPNELVCDFMNEQAYQAAFKPLKRLFEN